MWVTHYHIKINKLLSLPKNEENFRISFANTGANEILGC